MRRCFPFGQRPGEKMGNSVKGLEAGAGVPACFGGGLKSRRQNLPFSPYPMEDSTAGRINHNYSRFISCAPQPSSEWDFPWFLRSKMAGRTERSKTFRGQAKGGILVPLLQSSEFVCSVFAVRQNCGPAYGRKERTYKHQFTDVYSRQR